MNLPRDLVPCTWPFAGVAEETSFDKQIPLTCSDAFNVRNRDEETGRLRGSKRPGHTLVGSIGDYQIRDLLSVPYVQPTVTYFMDDPATEWTAGGEESRCGETDVEGNTYALSGDATLTKRSASNVVVYAYPVPVDPGSRCGTLDVDEGTNVYVGVSGRRGPPAATLGTAEHGNGLILGDPTQARLIKLRHAFRNNDEDTEPELEVAWSLTADPDDDGPTLWGLVGYVRVRGGRLYTLQHDNRQWKSWLVIYDNIHAGVPTESFVYRMPYPASSVDVDRKGRIAITVENFIRRGQNPEHPECTADLVGWNVQRDLHDEVESDKKKLRRFSDYIVDAKYLLTTGGITPEDGDAVLTWLDASGNGRHVTFFGGSPIYRANALAGKPSLWCNGTTHLLVASESPTQAADFRDLQRGIFPTYSDPDDAERSAQYAAFALFRPEALDDSALTDQFPAWSHGTSYSTLVDRSALMINRKASDTLNSAGNTESGSVSWFHRASASDPGEGTASGLMPAWMPDAFTNGVNGTNTANALLVTVIADNGVDAGDITSTRSLLRIWGKPVDRFTQEPDTLTSKAVQYLMGGDADVGEAYAGMSLCTGEWYRLLVLDRRDLDAVGADSILGHSLEPDEASGTRVGQVVIADEGAAGANLTNAPLAFSAAGASTPATGTWSATNGKIHTAKITQPGVGYTSRPTVTATGFGGGESLLAGMIPGPGAGTPNTCHRIEAGIAYEYGLGHMLPTGAETYTVNRVNSSGDAGVYHWHSSHPFFYGSGAFPFTPSVGCPENDVTQGLHRFAHNGEILILMDPSGKLLDVKSHDLNGIGLGCRWNADGTALYTAGNTNGSDASGSSIALDVAAVRKWDVSDLGVLTQAWEAETALHMSGQSCGIKVDKAGNVYVPVNAPADTADAETFIVLRNLDGSRIHAFSHGAGADNQGAFWIALPREIDGADLMPTNPDYADDLADEVSEFVYVFGRVDDYGFITTGETAVRKYRLVTATPNGLPPRLRADTAVMNGSIYRYDGAPSAVISGGAGVLHANSGAVDYVHSMTAFQKGYYTDGVATVVYDPKAGTVAPWVATRGTLPSRCRIIEFWRGRTVHLGDGTGAVNFSRALQPDDHDKSPPVPTVDQACDFATTQIGNVPDIANGFIPYNKNIAVIGCDSSIYILRGDPMDSNARLDLVSKTVGMAFGRAWCMDGEGSIWFLGSRGGLYVMAGPYGEEVKDGPDRASRFKIQKRLSTIDLSSSYVRLVYDEEKDGIWIKVISYATPTETVETYFYEMKQGAFWPDFIDDPALTVTAITVVDGDLPDDRRVLTGHADGKVRFVDAESTTDGGVPIRASVLMGPFSAGQKGQEIATLAVGCSLAGDQNGCAWALYASDRADDKGPIRRQGTFLPGANALASARALGTYVWLELIQTSGPSRFAFESAFLDVELRSRSRVRS